MVGKQEFIDLEDQAYGEWIIYEDKIPKFHISCFRENSKSDIMIKELIEKNNWTIEKILEKINLTESKCLELETSSWDF